MDPQQPPPGEPASKTTKDGFDDAIPGMVLEIFDRDGQEPAIEQTNDSFANQHPSNLVYQQCTYNRSLCQQAWLAQQQRHGLQPASSLPHQPLANAAPLVRPPWTGFHTNITSTQGSSLSRFQLDTPATVKTENADQAASFHDSVVNIHVFDRTASTKGTGTQSKQEHHFTFDAEIPNPASSSRLTFKVGGHATLPTQPVLNDPSPINFINTTPHQQPLRCLDATLRRTKKSNHAHEDDVESFLQPRKKRTKLSKTQVADCILPSVSLDSDDLKCTKGMLPVPSKYPTSLAVPSDRQKLSNIHCLIREQILEIFVVDGEEAGSLRGCVGLRCIYCARARKRLDRIPADEVTMAVFYPKSCQEIYRSMTSWQHSHVKRCHNIPGDIRKRWEYLRSSDKKRGDPKHWLISANAIGLRDVPYKMGGIYFELDQNGDPRTTGLV